MVHGHAADVTRGDRVAGFNEGRKSDSRLVLFV